MPAAPEPPADPTTRILWRPWTWDPALRAIGNRLQREADAQAARLAETRRAARVAREHQQ